MDFSARKGSFNFELSLQKVYTYKLFGPRTCPQFQRRSLRPVRGQAFGREIMDSFSQSGSYSRALASRLRITWEKYIIKDQLRQFGSADNVEGRKNLTSLGDWEVFRHEKGRSTLNIVFEKFIRINFLALEPAHNFNTAYYGQ